MQTSQLPYVDEYEIEIAAGVDDVWQALTDIVDRSMSTALMTRYTRIIGCADRAASGPRPLAQASTIPGFRVTVANPGSELVLVGRHYFSTYALIFRLEKIDVVRSRLNAESRASFPGFAGKIYKLLIIGTHGHIAAIRRLLSAVSSRSEARK